MLLQTLRQDANKAVFLCQLLAMFRVPNPVQAMLQKLFSAVPEPTQTFYWPASPTMPTVFCGYCPSLLFVAINGAENLTLARGLWNGYPGSAFSPRNDPQNDWLVAAATSIANELTLRFPAGRPRTILTGFSAGGAIALNVATLLPPIFQRPTVETITFGSPRPGGISLARNLRTLNPVRWMNDDDWVPLIPPQVAYFTQLGVAYGTRAQQRFQNFVQPEGGILLGNTGSVGAAQLPNIATVPSVADFAADILGGYTGLAPTHALDEYQRRLVLAADRQTIGGGGSDWGGTEERPNPISAAAIARERDAASVVIYKAGEEQNSAGIALPDIRLFKARRTGRVWWVYFGDQRISAGPTRKRARAVARTGNEFLRRLQGQAFTDPATLETQFSNYIQAASDPASGFVPTLRIRLPNP